MFDNVSSLSFDSLNFTVPRVHLGAGRFEELPDLIAASGKRVLLVLGKSSFRNSHRYPFLLEALESRNVAIEEMSVTGEPSPELVDDAVSRFREARIELVVAIGGGSVMDAAKAIAGLLPFGNPVMDHLEGVGKGIPYTGPAAPFIAVPTTAGTGSEATKNAVLSRQGPHGFKKSFRHDTLVPRVALVDPELLENCSAERIAANGMDAFTQLLESYVSLRAMPFTDALAWSGMRAMNESLVAVYHEAEKGGTITNTKGLTALAYGSLLSGITLAHAGLGSVHGIASPLGSFFPIPHGVVCGTLMARAVQENIDAMQKRAPDSHALKRYAAVGLLLAGENPHRLRTTEERLATLVEILSKWTATMRLPRLAEYGVTENDFGRIVADSRGNSMKTNPIELTDEEIRSILVDRL